MTVVGDERYEEYLRTLIGTGWDSMSKEQKKSVKGTYILVKRGIDWADAHPIK